MSKYRCTLIMEAENYKLFENTNCQTIELEAIGTDKLEVITDVIDMKTLFWWYTRHLEAK